MAPARAASLSQQAPQHTRSRQDLHANSKSIIDKRSAEIHTPSPLPIAAHKRNREDRSPVRHDTRSRAQDTRSPTHNSNTSHDATASTLKRVAADLSPHRAGRSPTRPDSRARAHASHHPRHGEHKAGSSLSGSLSRDPADVPLKADLKDQLPLRNGRSPGAAGSRSPQPSAIPGAGASRHANNDIHKGPARDRSTGQVSADSHRKADLSPHYAKRSP